MSKFVTVHDAMAGALAINLELVLFAEPCEVLDGGRVIGRGVRLMMACPASIRHESGLSGRDPGWEPRDGGRIGPYALDVFDDARGYRELLLALRLFDMVAELDARTAAVAS
jgi:hypothetical protein